MPERTTSIDADLPLLRGASMEKRSAYRRCGSILAFLTCVAAMLCAALYDTPWKTSRGSKESACPFGYGSTQTRKRRAASDPSKAFVHGSIWTGQDEIPWVSALLVSEEGKILALGETQEILSLAGDDVEVVSLEGNYVYPGFHDSHVHLITGGLSLQSINLSNSKSKGELIRRVRDGMTDESTGGWIIGFGWDEQHWGGEWPHADWLEQLGNERPMLLFRNDMHAALVNRRALDYAGIKLGTPDPPSGRIGRDHDTGHPNGLLFEHAILLVTSGIPPISVEARKQAVHNAASYLLARGVTCVHDMGRIPWGPLGKSHPAWDDFQEVYLPMADSGSLPIRIYALMPMSSRGDLADHISRAGFRHPGEYLWWGGVKEFYDGSLGSRTALMREPYEDAPEEYGVQVITKADFERSFSDAASKGLSVAVHAIGDKAIQEVSDVFAGGSDRLESNQRHRVEHAQHLGGPPVALQLSASGAMASIQPLHMESDVPTLEQRLGKVRAGKGHAFAYRTLLRQGVLLAMGSDWPVARSDPLSAIVATVLRNSTGFPWLPEESLSVQEAILATTRDAALASNVQDLLGTLGIGNMADLVVLDGDIESTVAYTSQAPNVRTTYLGGRCVHGCTEPS